eukprot:CAMPEP_0172497958 /NCGR_PEP_ID=MMETSP1066-20121228/107532_1 /TAXON_ID=671091 /ORGANISM="Coscinodiscus wailesii, Strain CCMP2513" /LENGTH=219 /DNA_ID=CAMNT_0013271011 /DNA_START=603 /DNA_END=1262 /DNA_ORIENTATION=+
MTANSGLWNMEQRFSPLLPQKLFLNNNDCSIWEVGANIRAADIEEFMGMYPNCHYHGYEPVPIFFTQLEHYWKSGVRKEKSVNLALHNYGIDSHDATFSVSKAALKGEGTYLGNGNDVGGIPIKIKSFDNAVEDAGGIYPTLFHVNCEGCEWDMLSNLLRLKSFRKIPIIQFGTHNYGKTVGERAWELCRIREKLAESHVMVYGIAFGWERWVLKTLSS